MLSFHFRRIFGKFYNGSTCKFGEQVHYKLSGHPSSRVEPRWELGAGVGKTLLTDDMCSGLSLESGTAERSISCRSVTATAKALWITSWALRRIPSQTVRPRIHRSRDSTSLNDGDEHGGTPGCPRYEGRGTMTHSETCRKRFEEIEMKKLNIRLEEECARIRERPSETVNEMDVDNLKNNQ